MGTLKKIFDLFCVVVLVALVLGVMVYSDSVGDSLKEKETLQQENEALKQANEALEQRANEYRERCVEWAHYLYRMETGQSAPDGEIIYVVKKIPLRK